MRVLVAVIVLALAGCSSILDINEGHPRDSGSAPDTPSSDAPLSTMKSITGFSIAGATGTINEGARTIAVSLPFGAAVTALVATFTTTGAEVEVGSTVQVSGTTTNDFTNPVMYVVTAADSSTATYTVTVTVAASSMKTLATFAFTTPPTTGSINEGAKTVDVVVPFGTNVSALVATFTTTGASLKVGTTVQVSGTTANDFTNPVMYVVTAADSSTATYTVTVTVAASSMKTLATFAFTTPPTTGSINEGAKTVDVVVPFGTNVSALVATFTTTGASLKVGTTVQVSGTTANDFTNPVMYVVTAADSSTATYTVTVTVAASSMKTLATFAFTTPPTTGSINEGAKTVDVVVPFGTNVSALVATFTTTGASLKVGTTVQVSGTTANDFTSPVMYIVTAADSSTATYTVTVTVAASPMKALTSYGFTTPNAMGLIDEGAKTIAVTVPFGTNVTALVATFSTTGASVKIGAATQVSGTTANNFTNPVPYIVTAADNSTVIYTVTVTVAASPLKQLTSFGFTSPNATGAINEGAKTVAVTVPFGTNVTALVATFTMTGASVRVGSTIQVSGTTANNFTGAVFYVVTAADASTVTYTVTVTVAPCTFINATGGTTITEVGDFRIHTFLSSGIFTITCGTGTIESLVVGGGGGSDGDGAGVSGGGGAGGVLHTSPGASYSPQSLPITVGGGGVGAAAGQSSTFDSITAIGGGYGASSASTPQYNGGIGGSGGGAGPAPSGVPGMGTGSCPGVTCQGFAGGTGAGGIPPNVGGGGGGAGGNGGNGGGDPGVGGAGGIGRSISISGTATFYGSGGGGGVHFATSTPGAASPGGGGAGAKLPAGGGNGTDGLGGGAGGGGSRSNGGSGVVILRYKFK